MENMSLPIKTAEEACKLRTFHTEGQPNARLPGYAVRP